MSSAEIIWPTQNWDHNLYRGSPQKRLISWMESQIDGEVNNLPTEKVHPPPLTNPSPLDAVAALSCHEHLNTGSALYFFPSLITQVDLLGKIF